MNSINCISLKANVSTKTDITIVIHDETTNQKPSLSFSIKAQLESPCTLLNVGKTTNFIYEIQETDLTKNEINEINSISTRSKIMDRIKSIETKGVFFKFLKS